MYKPKTYNLTPARGQALLNFQGRIFPGGKMELFETEVIEEIRQPDKQKQSKIEKQKEPHGDFQNLLIHGDALSACAYLKSKDIKVDLVYIDPPFASGANYAKTLFIRNGIRSSIQSEDITLGEEVMYSDIWQKEDYLNWFYERLLAIRDVMSEKAGIYVHLDWHIGHYAKLLLDEVFGEENFVNEIVWVYNTGGVSDKIGFAKKHDTLFYYAKDKENTTWNPVKAKSYIRGDFFNPEQERAKELGIKKDEYGLYRMTLAKDVWEIRKLFRNSPELENYATQKPEELIERVLKASSNEGLIVADFFAGSGTTAKVAHGLNRKFISCDIGLNAIQTSRDRLVKIGAEFDILKVKDGVRLFRNPAQTTAKIFSLIDGFKTRTNLGLGEFWDGGIADEKGSYIPVKFIQIHDRLTKELLDVILEEIYRLQDAAEAVSKIQVIYAHKDPDIDQSYVNKQVREAQKTNVSIQLIGLDELLQEKADKLFMPDNAVITKTDSGKTCKVKIKRFYSPYLKAKVDEFNAKKVQKPTQDSIVEEEPKKETKRKKVIISDLGLELIEAAQFDTTLKKNGVWTSNIELEDKAGVKEKIKGEYEIPTKRFKMKIRNIAGDEIVIDSEEIK